MLQVALFLSIVLTALALIPGGAHLFEMPNKMHLGRDDYFVVQGIYRGWQAVGFLVIAAFAANVWAAVLAAGQPTPFRLLTAAAALILASFAIWLVWTLPMNKVTRFWTEPPPNWEQVRRQWERSHAANAVVTFAALCCAAAATVTATAGTR